MNRVQYLNARHDVRATARSCDMLRETATDRECERRYALYSAAIARCPTGLTLRGPQHGRFALDAQFPAWFKRREDLRIRRARAQQVAA